MPIPFFVVSSLPVSAQVGHGARWPGQPLRGRNSHGERDGSSGAGGVPSISLVHVQRTGAEEIYPVSSRSPHGGGSATELTECFIFHKLKLHVIFTRYSTYGQLTKDNRWPS